jgi:hypothetical protein
LQTLPRLQRGSLRQLEADAAKHAKQIPVKPGQFLRNKGVIPSFVVKHGKQMESWNSSAPQSAEKKHASN